jgi:hypothetical protein
VVVYLQVMQLRKPLVSSLLRPAFAGRAISAAVGRRSQETRCRTQEYGIKHVTEIGPSPQPTPFFLLEPAIGVFGTTINGADMR